MAWKCSSVTKDTAPPYELKFLYCLVGRGGNTLKVVFKWNKTMKLLAKTVKKNYLKV